MNSFMLYDILTRYKKQLMGILIFLVLATTFFQWRRSGEVGAWTFVDRIFVTVVGHVQSWSRDISLGIRSVWKNYFALVGAAQENDGLRSAIKSLEEKIHSLREVESENTRLRKLLGFSERLSHKFLPAQVVGENLQGDFRTLRVNKGTKSRVRQGAAVVTSDGVVGRVLRVEDDFADVLTIIDANSSLDGMGQRTRARGVVEGRNINRLFMRYLERDDDVLESDLIVTTGLDGDYPKGILIGKVTKVERKKWGISQDVVMEPSVDFTKVEEVFIITGEN